MGVTNGWLLTRKYMHVNLILSSPPIIMIKDTDCVFVYNLIKKNINKMYT